MQKNKLKRRYISSLDGLRAISIIGVLFYHLSFPFAVGGYLGVTVFFVLSGYLITDLLLYEYETTQRINLKQFWIRRFKRLLPALFTMLFLLVIWITLFQREFLTGLREDVLASIFYVSNWWYVAQEQSYFTKFSAPSPLQHMWSLAVEEQFYIIWPLLIIAGFVFFTTRMRLLRPMAILTVLSALAMAIGFTANEDPSRLYYGTDTRAFSLIIGAMLAVVWPSAKMTKSISPAMRNKLDWIGISALLLLGVMFLTMKEDSAFLYRGGMLLASIITAIIIAVITLPSSRLATALSFKPFVWLGKRSYGLYLWHFPIIILMGGGIADTPLTSKEMWYAVGLAIILTELSWHLIEQPIKKASFKKLKKWRWTPIKTWSLTRKVTFFTSLALLTIFIGGLVWAKSQQQATEELKAHLQQAEQQMKQNQQTIDEKKATEEKKTTQNEAPSTVTAIGDSVMMSAAESMKNTIPNLYVDAVKGRQPSEAITLLQQLNEQQQLGDIIVIGLGANGAFSEQDMATLLDVIGTERTIFLINTNVNRYWKEQVNTLFSTTTQQHDNVRLIDWDTLSRQRPNIFYEDQIHPNQEGSLYYANVIKEAVDKVTK